jgi:NTE family protein
MKTFALALGGGGARGLAHVAIVEALDELGVKPVAIAGTSIGALVGAAYAAGMRGKDIRHHVISHAHDRGKTTRRLVTARAGRLGELFSGDFGRAAQIDPEKFCALFMPKAVPARFSDLAIPLTVIATDLHRRRELPLTSGPLHAAVAASIAIPGPLRPVVIGDRVLVDGGVTNPLPFDRLRGLADYVVAVDVSSVPPAERADVPTIWESVSTTLNIMGDVIVAAKLAHGPPDLVIRPNVAGFHTLDFFLASAILRAAEPSKTEVKDRLGALLAA